VIRHSIGLNSDVSGIAVSVACGAHYERPGTVCARESPIWSASANVRASNV
jgi:hypothetical protein